MSAWRNVMVACDAHPSACAAAAAVAAVVVVSVCLLLLLLFCGEWLCRYAAPSVTRILPLLGSTAATMITIDGADFGDTEGRVAIGDGECWVLRWSATSIECRAPRTTVPASPVMVEVAGQVNTASDAAMYVW